MIETIVALGVIVTGMVGAISLVAFSLRASGTSLSRLVALNLTWEGIEVVQNIRDSNYLSGDPFNTGLDGGGDQTAIAVFDPLTGWSFDFAPNTLSDDTTILYQQGGLYTQSTLAITGTPTPYRRLLILDNSTADQVRVLSTVQWTEGSTVRQVQAERIFYNWR